MYFGCDGRHSHGDNASTAAAQRQWDSTFHETRSSNKAALGTSYSKGIQFHADLVPYDSQIFISTSQTICWTAALAEVATILAAVNPQLPISHKILAKVVFSGNADNIRPSPLFFFGTFLAGLGGYIRYSCYRALGKFFTFEMSIRKGHQLITNGPYRVVRHPAYTGIIFSVTGLICWHGSPVRIVDMCFFFLHTLF